MALTATTLKETYRQMAERLDGIVPDIELRYKAELAFEINTLKKERGAIILGHNYMEPALYHSVPDVVGDSLELSRKAAETDADPIVFCGVRFMAETAKILNPDKTVLLPARVAGCSLAASITARDVRNLRDQYPGVPIVTYINTYADVKAECDICCTSGNAHKGRRIARLGHHYLFARRIPGRQCRPRETDKRIIFPTTTGFADPKPGLEYEMIGWHGRCEVHEQFTVQDIENARIQFPDVVVLAHPECSPEVVAASDFSGSTSRMVDYVREMNAERYLLLTECSMGDNIAAENPDKEMVGLCSIRCPHMNEITLEDTRNALLNDEQIIEVPEDIRIRAFRAVERMLEIK